MRRVLIATAAAAMILGTVGTAPAAQAAPSKLTPIERAYLVAVKKNADTIGVAPGKDLLNLGYATCKAFKVGVRPAGVVKELTDAGITPNDAGVVIGASVATLCPKYAGMVKKYINS